MIKKQIYKNIIARKSGKDYSPGMQFQTSITNVDKAKALTMNNQPGKLTDKRKRNWCVSLDHLRINSKEFHIGLSYQNAKKSLGMGISQQEAKKAE